MILTKAQRRLLNEIACGHVRRTGYNAKTHEVEHRYADERVVNRAVFKAIEHMTYDFNEWVCVRERHLAKVDQAIRDLAETHTLHVTHMELAQQIRAARDAYRDALGRQERAERTLGHLTMRKEEIEERLKECEVKAGSAGRENQTQ